MAVSGGRKNPLQPAKFFLQDPRNMLKTIPPADTARYTARRDKLRRSIKKAGVDALLVTSFTNVTYLTGFTGDDSYLLVLPKGEVLLTDPRYTTQLEEECPGLKLEIRQPGV